MSMDNDQESLQFWSSLFESLADSHPKNDLYPEISGPLLSMSTSVAIDVPHEPPDARGPEEVERFKEKEIVEFKERENGPEEERKSLGKRPRSNGSRNIAEKKRRNDIRNKLENLKQLTPNCKQRDTASALECIINHIRSMKLYVESMGPMLPLGMKMDFPAPWLPFIHPNYIMPPFNGFIHGEISGHDQQIVPDTTKEFNDQP